MYMIMFVLDNPDFLPAILKKWTENEIMGATIVESSGAYRQLRKHIPMRYGYGQSEIEERGNITIFLIVNELHKIQVCLGVIEEIVGNLDDPNTGIFTAWPLLFTKGIPS